MDSPAIFNLLSSEIVILALSMMRIGIAFLMLPLFSDELIPPLIRNSIFVTLALVVLLVQPQIDVDLIKGPDWVLLFSKEAFIGLCIGFFFGLFLWAFEAAGTIIDTQIGASLAMVYDPISGHEVTLLGEFLGRWINFLFLATGGLLLLSLAILESYVVWPIDQYLPDLRTAAVEFFEMEFSRFIKLTFMIATPVIVVIFIVDMSMGLINRFAKRLDILFISLALKGLVALLMMLILVPTLVEVMLNQLDMHNRDIEGYLLRVLQ